MQKEAKVSDELLENSKSTVDIDDVRYEICDVKGMIRDCIEIPSNTPNSYILDLDTMKILNLEDVPFRDITEILNGYTRCLGLKFYEIEVDLDLEDL